MPHFRTSDARAQEGGRDGAAGLARIKQSHGIAIVQSPASATRTAMPEAALASAAVDWILPLDEIGPRLTALHLEAARGWSAAVAPVHRVGSRLTAPHLPPTGT